MSLSSCLAEKKAWQFIYLRRVLFFFFFLLEGNGKVGGVEIVENEA